MSCIVNCTTCKTDNKLLLLETGKLAISQYPEGLVTGHLDTGFSWFPCVLEYAEKPPQSSAEVEGRVELHFYFPSRSSWPVIG